MYLTMWLLDFLTIAPRDLKIDTNVQLDPGRNLVNVRTTGEEGTSEAAEPEKLDFLQA